MPPSRARERELARLRQERQALRREAARRRARRRTSILASVLAVLLLAGGAFALVGALRNDDKTTPGANGSPSPGTAFPPVPAGADPRLKTKPVASVPKVAPTKLAVTDVIQGKGAAAKAGSKITVNYVGVSFPDGKEFDSSWKRSETFPLTLGQGEVIPGWDQGLVGMKVGGRRQLAIPAALAYGAQGQPPSIKPNTPLIFVVDLLALS